MPEKVFCLVLHYNKQHDTATCLTSLLRSDLPRGTEVIVIDNGEQGSSAFFHKHFPTVRYLRSPGNIGYAAGNNQGLEIARREGATHVVLLNPDVTVPRVFVRSLLKTMARTPRIGIIAPAHTEGRGVYGLGGHIEWSTFRLVHDNVTTLPARPRRYGIVTFACVCIKAEVLATAGMLDERYFLYLEDVDYCVAAARAGYEIYLDPSVVVTHKTSSSYSDPRRKIMHSLRSAILFVAKWYTFPRNILPLLHTLYFYPKEWSVWSLRLAKRSILKEYAHTP